MNKIDSTQSQIIHPVDPMTIRDNTAVKTAAPALSPVVISEDMPGG